MEYWKFIIDTVISLLVGGGVATLATVKYQRINTRANAEKAGIEVVKGAAGFLMEDIVEPLRKEIQLIRNELNRLRKAIEKINACPYAADCPVRRQLFNEEGNCGGAPAGDGSK